MLTRGLTAGLFGLATLLGPMGMAATGDGVAEMPAFVVQAPKWTADVRDAPLSRVLVAVDIVTFDEPLFGPLTLVGPDDAYRIFDPSSSGGRWTGELALSPDGRYVLTGHDRRTQLLDVTTGETRMWDKGSPLAWAPDGRHAVLVRFDNDAEVFPVSGRIEVVDVPSGDTAWTVPLDPGPLPREVEAAISPDGSTLAVQRHGDLFAYRRDGVQWKRAAEGWGLPGQLAWTPDGRNVVVEHYGLCPASMETGESVGCVLWQQLLSKGPGKVQTFGQPKIVSWDRTAQIVSLPRDVVRLTDRAEVLLRAPEYTRELQVATTGVRWTARSPGEPDLGPLFDRYRPAVDIAWRVLLGLAVVVVLGLILRRRRVVTIPG